MRIAVLAAFASLSVSMSVAQAAATRAELPAHPRPTSGAGYYYTVVRARIGSARESIDSAKQHRDMPDLRTITIKVAKSYLVEGGQYLKTNVMAKAPMFGKARKARYQAEVVEPLRAGLAQAWGEVNALEGAGEIDPYDGIDAGAYEKTVRSAARKELARELVGRPSAR